jgi:hypothetical protein
VQRVPPHPESENVEVIETQTADEFLAYLDRSGTHWGGTPNVPWVFRGHADDKWRLLPSAWREEGSAALRNYFGRLAATVPPAILKTPEGAARVLIAAECEAVGRFVDLADELGLSISGGANVPSGEAALAWVEESEIEPSIAFALAQHHGIPTHLLDWTRNPEVAAFFAADEGESLRAYSYENTDPDDGSGPDCPSHICVWAIDTSRLRRFEMPVPDRGTYRELRRFTVPRAEHTYLHAQAGLFLYDSTAVVSGKPLSFDQVLALDRDSISPPSIRKITLPILEAGELLWRLYRRRVSRAHLMPTFDNVALVSQSIRHWEGPDWECGICHQKIPIRRITCPRCRVRIVARPPG